MTGETPHLILIRARGAVHHAALIMITYHQR